MRRHLLLALSLSVAACTRGIAQSAEPAPPPVPRLVLFIAVDQMRPDYFTRYASEYTGGLKRLYQGSAFYSRGEQDHAITETAPGHATMLSGRSPGSTGIPTNEFGVPDTASPLLGVPGAGASPARFKGTALYDWMKAADPGVRVLSVSRKDRGAILPIGRAKVPVYWYQGGYFTTSTWYGTELPQWLMVWNGRKGPMKLAGTWWDLLLAEANYPEPDDQPWERGGNNNVFPHPFGADSTIAAAIAIATPYLDSLTMDVALEGVKALKLGQRNKPDLLSVSLSSTDAVGHVYGPDSRELHDQMLRLDRWLGWFFDSLAKQVPLDRTLIVLTSDHGVTSFPEYAASKGRMAGRAIADSVALMADQALVATKGRSFGLGLNNGLLLGNVAALDSAGVNVDSLSAALASGLARTTGVTRVYTRKALAQASPDDLDAMRWRRTIPEGFPWLAAASLAPGYIWSFNSAATTHGTTNADDVRVPILFMGAGITPGVIDRTRTATVPPPRTIDIAPTIAALLGIKPLEMVEGVVLPEVVKRP
jgi:predicted AlkP superfamily pyrophosphatase or phosphodiesterase